jgi:hypothetical protein
VPLAIFALPFRLLGDREFLSWACTARHGSGLAQNAFPQAVAYPQAVDLLRNDEAC